MNTPLSIAQLYCGGNGINTSGGWMTTLLSNMSKHTNDKYAAVSFGDKEGERTSRDKRITSFTVKGALREKATPTNLRKYADIVTKWAPDLIHIHGTEAVFGLLTTQKMINVPTIISLQGLLGPCSQWYRFFGTHGLTDIFKMHRWVELLSWRGLGPDFWSLQKLAQRERKIIKGNRYFIGRTEWDASYLKALNPDATYIHAGEILRNAFWQKTWDISQIKRHRVIFTNAGYPRKGTEILIDAITLLKNEYPDIQICIAGEISQKNGYGRYINRRLKELGTSAIPLGRLNAEEMVDELTKSHVFISPSFIDNSPNAVCEAQLVGMPVVSTYTGGVPSLIRDGQTGLFFPTGDAPMLAAQIRKVFQRDHLAINLGKQSQKKARVRHAPETIIKDIYGAYGTMLKTQTVAA